MKIIQSYWSKPYSYSKDRNGGWYNKAFHYMSCALSCLKLSEFYEIELITDLNGKRIFFDEIGLPFNSVKTDLESISNYPPELWAIGKLFSFRMQDTPFIHVDNDIFIWGHFSENIEKADLISQNKEENYTHNYKFFSDIIENFEYIPKSINNIWDKEKKVTIANAGIIGGNNLDFIHEYVKEAFLFIENNLNNLHKLKYKDKFNIIYEQYLFYSLSHQKEIPITFFIKEQIDDKFRGLVNFWETPFSKKYIHALASYKHHYIIGEQIAQRLWFEYPDYFNRIHKLIKRGIL